MYYINYIIYNIGSVFNTGRIILIMLHIYLVVIYYSLELYELY